MATKPTQAENLPDLLLETNEATDNKATAGTASGDALYTGYNNTYADYCVLICTTPDDDTESEPDLYEPDFEPLDATVRTNSNHANGNGGARQMMQVRAGQFAKWCKGITFSGVWSDGKTWRVSGDGRIEEMNDTVKI